MRLLVLMLLLGACASASTEPTTNPAPTARPAHEIVSGGGDLRGGTIRMAATIGGPLGPRSTTKAIRPAGVVTP